MNANRIPFEYFVLLNGKVGLKAFIQSHLSVGYQDYDKILRTTRSRLLGKIPLMVGDIFFESEHYIYVYKLMDGENFLAIAGNPGDLSAMEFMELNLSGLAEFGNKAGYLTLEFLGTNPGFVLGLSEKLKQHQNENNK